MDTKLVWHLSLLTVIFLSAQFPASSENSGSHVMINIVIDEYENTAGTSYNGSDASSTRKCCDGGTRPNCTTGDTCDTLFVICVGKMSEMNCSGISYMSKTFTNTNKNDADNGITFSVTRLHAWPITVDDKLTVSVYDEDNELNRDPTFELIDRVSRHLRITPDVSFWTATPHNVTLQNNTRLVLTVKLFCESDYFGPDCDIHQAVSPSLSHTSHVEMKNNKPVNVLDCTQKGSAMVEIQTKRPYFYTPLVLKTGLSYFTADKLCLTSTTSVSVALINVRYSSAKSTLRVVFSGNCSRGNRVTPISTVMVEQVLLFISHDEMMFYFHGKVVTSNATSSLATGNYQVFISIIHYTNPNSSVWVKQKDHWKLISCNGGCRPIIQLQYRGYTFDISKSSIQTDDLQSCFNYLVPLDTTGTDEEIPSMFLFPIPYNWTNHESMTINVIHDNILTTYPIATFSITPPSYMHVGRSYQHTRPAAISMQNDTSGVNIELELLVWCSLGHTGSNCEQACPKNNTKCNLEKCRSSNNAHEGYSCLNGDCINGRCKCQDGFAGSICRASISDWQLPDLTYRCTHGMNVNTTNDISCQCNQYYTGYLCDIGVNECLSNHCNKGVCENDLGGFTCTCTAGYTGPICDTDIDECTSSSCVNGTCVDQVNNYTCNCQDGFSGQYCDVDVDECTSSPCVNGTCVDQINNYMCDCQDGFSGRDCDVDVDECTSSPCVNGTCVDQINNYMCDCQDGFSGRDCDVDVDECTSSPCVNGTCVDQVNNYTCNCLHGFTGLDCDVDIDECTSSPCVNGTCVDKVNYYTCNCQDGFSGRNCDVDIDDCTSSPCVNGTCVDKVNYYTCNCQDGFSGRNCDVDIVECTSSPCVNGTCVDKVNNYTCNCQDGFSGRNCDVDIDDCTSSPCVHGTCVDQVNSYTCNCQDGFAGWECDIDVDDCLSQPCDQHQGTCVDSVNNYTCNCSPGFSDRYCHTEIDECDSSPCQYGTCQDVVNGYLCSCHFGYTGRNCEINIDECRNDPCVHGTCFDGVAGYLCQCSDGFGGKNCADIIPPKGTCDEGWTGKSCDTDIDECTSSPCHDSSVCVNLPGSYVCDKNDCFPSPCSNGGLCLDIGATFFCQCKNGFEGRTCELDVNECFQNPCINGATCVNTMGSYMCNCLRGYVGILCEVNIFGLLGNGCQNRGVAQIVGNSIVCQCTKAYTGSRCETVVDLCALNPCQNGASCESLPGRYTCYCNPGFVGTTCEVSVNLVG